MSSLWVSCSNWKLVTIQKTLQATQRQPEAIQRQVKASHKQLKIIVKPLYYKHAIPLLAIIIYSSAYAEIKMQSIPYNRASPDSHVITRPADSYSGWLAEHCFTRTFVLF